MPISPLEVVAQGVLIPSDISTTAGLPTVSSVVSVVVHFSAELVTKALALNSLVAEIGVPASGVPEVTPPLLTSGLLEATITVLPETSPSETSIADL